MKKFKFRLESLLKVKEHLERERQKEHAAARERVAHQQDRLSEIDAQRQTTVKQQRQRLTGDISVADLLVCSRFLVKLKSNTLEGTEILRGLEAEADKSRDRLIDASRQKKIYEKLRERQREKHLEEMKRLENKEIDEIATNSRRQKGG
ncbi:MAG: flagellar export protein FliJ [Candidatus Zixiibacteriota bacterium]|nr:MAG: flagellar export protein FliJ [candidate division Zixibacteria bacterium]